MKMQTRLIACAMLVAATLLCVPRHVHAQSPPDPAHTAHVAAGTAATGQPLDTQLAELRAKLEQLETTLQQQSGSAAVAPGPVASVPAPAPKTDAAMAGMPGMSAKPKPMQGGNMAPAPGGAMNMMGMMDKMMGMMDKMMSMGGGAMPAGGASMAPAGSGGMGMMEGEMGGGSMPAGMPPTAMSGGMGMMAMDKMEMMGMMGGMPSASGSSMAMASTFPGFPGASHLYHIGSTGFFLDHPQHITLTTEQQKALNQIKERGALAKSTADRQVQEAEQQLWTLTAADQPDAAQIEVKVRQIEKLRGDERLAFIRAVGEAANVLSEEQRMTLVGKGATVPEAAGAAPTHQHKP